MSSETGEANIIQIFYRINNKFQPKRAVLTQRFENGFNYKLPIFKLTQASFFKWTLPPAIL